MSAVFFCLKNANASGSSHGSLGQDAVPLGGIATTGTGWTVGTTAGTAYLLETYGSKLAAAGFGAGAKPDAAPTTVDSWRSENKLTGVFAAGTWTVALSVIAVSNAASGTGKLRIRMWRSVNADGSSATEITTSTMATNQWSNLLTSAAQNLSATQNPGAITLTGEYLFVQIACVIDTASANASADVVLRVDGNNSRITTPTFTGNINGANTGGGTTYSSPARRDLPTVAGYYVKTEFGDLTPPIFGGCTSAGSPTGSTITLAWTPATDTVTPQASLVYDVYQATSSGAQSYTAPSYSSIPGATGIVIGGLAANTAYYFVVRARDADGNRDTNTTERTSTTLGGGGQSVFAF